MKRTVTVNRSPGATRDVRPWFPRRHLGVHVADRRRTRSRATLERVTTETTPSPHAPAAVNEVRPSPAPDLPLRIRRALAHRDRAELALLNPIVLALAKGEISLAEIEPLDAEQALWLVATRAQEAGEPGTRAFVRTLGG